MLITQDVLIKLNNVSSCIYTHKFKYGFSLNYLSIHYREKNILVVLPSKIMKH